MILNYNDIMHLCYNRKVLYEEIKYEENPFYDFEKIANKRDLIEMIETKINTHYFKNIHLNEDVYTVEFDSLDELKEKYSEALELCSYIEDEYPKEAINISFRIDNNFRLNKDNFKEVLEIKERIEKDGYNFVFSESIGFNESEWSLDDVVRTNEKLDVIVENIKQMDLSPLEKVLFAYNLVANLKTYKDSKRSSSNASRSIYAILDNDECVCLGFAQLLEAIINRLDDKSLKAYTNFLRTSKGAHANNFIYVNDEKYGVDGYYVFDSTGDNCTDKNVLTDRYKLLYFMLPLSAIAKIQDKKYRASNGWSGKSVVSVTSEVIDDNFVELLKKEQVGFDKDIDMLTKENKKEYFSNKSQAFDKSRFIELFTTAFPELTVKECKDIFRENQFWCSESFRYDSDEVIFYESDFDEEITENKKSKR